MRIFARTGKKRRKKASPELPAPGQKLIVEGLPGKVTFFKLGKRGKFVVKFVQDKPAKPSEAEQMEAQKRLRGIRAADKLVAEKGWENLSPI